MQVVSSTGTTTLTAAITTTGATAVSVASAQNLAVGVVIQVDTELMQITSLAGLNLTVTRGFNGTAAATHLNAATVTIMAGITIGPLLNSTTALPATALAVTFAQIRIDGAALAGSGTAVTTDTWGEATLFMALAAGQHRVTVQTTTTLPWCEPCYYVGAVGAQALANAGLALQVAGNIATGSTPTSTQITTNLSYASTNQTNLLGQILTFTTGVQAGKSYYIAAGSNAAGALKLTMSYPFTGTNPAAGDAFVMSNIATANALTVGMNALPQEVAALVIDMSEAYGGDGTPIATQNGLILGAMITNPAAIVAALVAAGVLQLVANSTTLYQFTAEAVANVPIPTVVNFSASTQIEEEIHHEHS